ncbi:MAG: methyltransferase family protein [Candidatus Kariarchaeaceae archaeon]|jgi:protein-S-isoprenylcysteine O-methyltransferase Ste14
MGIKDRWINTLHSMATGSRKLRNFYTPIGVFFYGFLVFIFVVVSLKFDKWLGVTNLFENPTNIVLAFLLFLPGLILLLWTGHSFLQAKGTPVPFNPPPKLVTSGPYAYTRNPMLTGVFSLLFGFGILLESISLLLIFTPLFILINYWELKSIEEPELEKRLGEGYIEYQKSTPMFIPKIR